MKTFETNWVEQAFMPAERSSSGSALAAAVRFLGFQMSAVTAMSAITQSVLMCGERFCFLAPPW